MLKLENGSCSIAVAKFQWGNGLALPEFREASQNVEPIGRGIRSKKRWYLRCRMNLNERLRNDHQLWMHPRYIEVVHMIRKMIPITEHPASRAHG